MSYSSTSDGTSSRTTTRNRSCVTETTMEYENSSVSTSSAVAVLYAQGCVGSVDSGSDSGASEAAVGEEHADGGDIIGQGEREFYRDVAAAAAVTPPSNRYLSRGDPGTEWSTPNILAEGSMVSGEEGGGEAVASITSGNPVLRLLEQEDSSNSILPMYRSKPSDEANAVVTRKRILLCLLVLLGLVCVAVGVYVAVPKKGANPAEARLGGDEDSIADNVFMAVPSPEPTPEQIAPVSISGLVPVNSQSLPTAEPTMMRPTTVNEVEIRSDPPTAKPTEEQPKKEEEEEESKPTPLPTAYPTAEPNSSGDSDTNILLCGGGERGSGDCPNPRHCCSTFGWCGSGSAYCD